MRPIDSEGSAVRVKLVVGVCVTWAVAAIGPAAAQGVAYKCGTHTYSEKPCAGRVVNTEEYHAPAAKKGITMAARRLPGESDDEFALRSRRVNLSQGDQDECKNLDKKIPFEEERLKHSVTVEETAQARESIEAAHKRFSKLGC